MKQGSTAKLAAAIALLAATTSPSFAWQSDPAAPFPVVDSGKLTVDLDAAAAARLADAMRAEVAKQPDAASAEDLEGVLVFTVSQGVYSDSVVGNALDAIKPGASANLLKAIENVRLALFKKKLNRGTAAIGNGGYGSGAGTGGGGGFTVPGVSTGGGGQSNYSSS